MRIAAAHRYERVRTIWHTMCGCALSICVYVACLFAHAYVSNVEVDSVLFGDAVPLRVQIHIYTYSNEIINFHSHVCVHVFIYIGIILGIIYIHTTRDTHIIL